MRNGPRGTRWASGNTRVHHTCWYGRIKCLMFQPPSARNNEKCANQIATNLAKKFGPGWNAVVGEAFSFEISYTKYVDIVDIICGIMKLFCCYIVPCVRLTCVCPGRPCSTCTSAATWASPCGGLAEHGKESSRRCTTSG